MSDIRITKSTKSNVESVDFDNIPFGRFFSDHMFIADYNGKEWTNMEIRPFGTLTMHPAMLALHYGQSIFEGMKATLHTDGTPLLFRPELHAKRLNKSAKRMCMPEFPEEVFIEALEELLRLDKQWIPSAQGSALYIRPFMFATDEMIGVRPSKNYRMIIFTQPVGPYYTKPVSLLVENKYIRAATGGVGSAKTCGNYAASLLPAKLAKEKGYDQVLWMDAKNFKYVQEVGTMNIFFVFKDKIVTPKAGGTILKGITRKSVLTLLNDKGYNVEIGKVKLADIKKGYKNGNLLEVFGTGTAAVIAYVNEIRDRDFVMQFDVEKYKVATMLYNTLNQIRNGQVADTHGWLHPVKEKNQSSEESVEQIMV